MEESGFIYGRSGCALGATNESLEARCENSKRNILRGLTELDPRQTALTLKCNVQHAFVLHNLNINSHVDTLNITELVATTEDCNHIFSFLITNTTIRNLYISYINYENTNFVECLSKNTTVTSLKFWVVASEVTAICKYIATTTTLKCLDIHQLSVTNYELCDALLKNKSLHTLHYNMTPIRVGDSNKVLTFIEQTRIPIIHFYGACSACTLCLATHAKNGKPPNSGVLDLEKFAKSISKNTNLTHIKLPYIFPECLDRFYDGISANASILSIDSEKTCTKMLDFVLRNRSIQWQNVRYEVLDFCLALAPLNLPAYVLLEIFDWLPNMALVNHCLKIHLIIAVKNSISKLK